MRQETAMKLLARCIRDITSGQAGGYLENPAVRFAKDADEGKYDSIPTPNTTCSSRKAKK